MSHDIDYNEIASNSIHFSGADTQALLYNSQLLSIHEKYESNFLFFLIFSDLIPFHVTFSRCSCLLLSFDVLTLLLLLLFMPPLAVLSLLSVLLLLPLLLFLSLLFFLSCLSLLFCPFLSFSCLVFLLLFFVFRLENGPVLQKSDSDLPNSVISFVRLDGGKQNLTNELKSAIERRVHY